MVGRILQNNNGLYSIETESGTSQFRARKGLKSVKLICGDMAIIEDGIIVGVMERKNLLIRPSVANVDLILAVICSVPKPDFLMLDKLIINCRNIGIDVGIVINKSDLNDKTLAQTVKREYSSVVDCIFETSATCDCVDEIANACKNRIVCLAGQSAVGKSSIINSLFKGELAKAGEMSKKISRGKNTTVSSRLYPINNGYVIDTPGFGLLDAHEIIASELKYFYPEYLQIGCEYANCNHVDEPGCKVREGAQKCLISHERYNRYRTLYTELKEKGEKYEKR